MSDRTRHGSEMSRRAVMAGTGVLAVSAALGACGSSGQQGVTPTSAAPEPTTVPPTTTSPAEPAPATTPAAATGEQLGSTSDVPVGGGTVFASKKVVVTQPVAGSFKGFSAICTHEGCTVNKVTAGTIRCPCHGSQFAIADGSVVHGPASRALAHRQITVSGDALLLE